MTLGRARPDWPPRRSSTGRGHTVSVYERADRIGGLLRYGIPDFKLSKDLLDKRLAQMEAEGVEFITDANVGGNVDIRHLKKNFNALLLAGGATMARDLTIPGRELKGVHFAMEFLSQQNKRLAGDGTSAREEISARDGISAREEILPEEAITATGKKVVVIGGGDTGSDCVGTSIRQGAESVTQIELLSQPPPERGPQNPWPEWPMILRTSSSHEEGAIRDWAINTKTFEGEDGRVKRIQAVRLKWDNSGGCWHNEEVPGSEFVIEADLILLAMGSIGPERNGMLEQLGVALDARGNVATDGGYSTSIPGIFAAGDMRRGQSLVVWAITEGRKAARAINQYL